MLTSTTTRALRMLPFVVLSMLSLWVAGRAPRGRKPFEFDMSISASALAEAVTKVSHLRSVAILFLLATLGVGIRRLPLAFGLTMLVGVGWELAETTVIGHHARLTDLAPDLVAALASLVVMLLARSVIVRVAASRRRGSREPVISAYHYLATSVNSLRKTAASLGKSVGPPWGKDQKDASLAAMIALQGQRRHQMDRRLENVK